MTGLIRDIAGKDWKQPHFYIVDVTDNWSASVTNVAYVCVCVCVRVIVCLLFFFFCQRPDLPAFLEIYFPNITSKASGVGLGLVLNLFKELCRLQGKSDLGLYIHIGSRAYRDRAQNCVVNPQTKRLKTRLLKVTLSSRLTWIITWFISNNVEVVLCRRDVFVEIARHWCLRIHHETPSWAYYIGESRHNDVQQTSTEE
jgi:hypothetical protein